METCRPMPSLNSTWPALGGASWEAVKRLPIAVVCSMNGVLSTANGGNPRCADGWPPPICSERRRPGPTSMSFLDQLRGVPVTHVATILKTNKHNRKLPQGSVQLFRNERVKAGVGPSYVLSIKGRSGVPIAISACTRRSSCRAEAEHKAPALLQFGLTTRDYHV